MVDYAGLSPCSTQTPAKEGVILLQEPNLIWSLNSVLTTHLSALLNSACRALSQGLLIHGDCLASSEIMIWVCDKLLGPFRAGHKCHSLVLCSVLAALSPPALGQLCWGSGLPWVAVNRGLCWFVSYKTLEDINGHKSSMGVVTANLRLLVVKCPSQMMWGCLELCWSAVGMWGEINWAGRAAPL